MRRRINLKVREYIYTLEIALFIDDKIVGFSRIKNGADGLIYQINLRRAYKMI